MVRREWSDRTGEFRIASFKILYTSESVQNALICAVDHPDPAKAVRLFGVRLKLL